MSTLPFGLADRLMAECADVIACVDGSDYLSSVCDHAAWVTSRCAGKLNLLSVREPASADDPRASAQTPLLMAAAARVEESGREVATSMLHAGEFVRAAEQFSRPDDILVVGRRGTGTLAGVGESVEALIRETDLRLLICGRVFLPISRALILPPTGSGALFASYVASTPLLDGIETDVTVIGARGLEVLRTAGRHASRSPMDQTEYDLAVVPRSLLVDDTDHLLARAARESLVGRRPVLVV